jgi:hypothetical protein
MANGNTGGGGGAAGASISPAWGAGQAAIGLLVQQIGSAVWTQWQIVRWTWYDFIRVPNTAAATTTTLTFFANALGAQDTVGLFQKTLEQTNVIQQGQFGQQYFVMQQIRTYLNLVPKARQTATTAATTTYTYDQLVIAQRLRTAFSTGVFDLTIGQKAYTHAMQPFRTMPPGFGLSNVIVPYDSVVNATGNAYVAQSNSLADVYNMTPPQLIEPAQTFQAQISFPDLGYNFHNAVDASGQNANVEAGVIFDGYLARPLQ